MDIVVCIDIGTVYSGYGYSSRKEYEQNIMNVHLNEEWLSGHANLHTFKTPSIVLLQSDKTLFQFGYEAERKYTQLMEAKQHDLWFFFKRFKTELKSKQLRKDTVIIEEGEKSLSAITLFTVVLKYLKTHFLSALEENTKYGTPSEIQSKGGSIRYIITVPTKWDNAAKDCMKTAAKKAGISPASCTIHTESEAAGRYCRFIPLRSANQESFYLQSPGSRHVIVNIGGNSIDTAMQDVLDDGKIKEFCKNVGNAPGATRVDLDFLKFINSLFPAEFIENYTKKHRLDFLELLYEFEVKKRLFTLESDQGTKLDLPSSLIKSYTTKYKQSIQFMIDDTDFVGKILSQDESIILDKTVMKDIFGPAVKSTVGYISNLSRDPEAKKCSAIILVGGFSNSPVVSGAVKFYFPNADITIADEPELAVILGGVLLGHNPGPSIPHKPIYSYGIGIAEPFDDNQHLKDKMFIAGNRHYCSDVFQVHIKNYKTIPIGEFCQPHDLTLNRPRQKKVTLLVYAAKRKRPKYTTDEDCFLLGKMIVNVPDSKDGKAKVKVQMALLGSSVIVEGVDLGSGTLTQTSFTWTKPDPRDF